MKDVLDNNVTTGCRTFHFYFHSHFHGLMYLGSTTMGFESLKLKLQTNVLNSSLSRPRECMGAFCKPTI